MATDSSDRGEDVLEQVRGHCDSFYREESISTYSNTRLAMLAAVNQHREQFIAWADQGLSFHGAHITIPSVEVDDDLPDPPSANDDPLQWYIQAETISLLHHALETLLQLYTGLVDASDWWDPLAALADRDRRLPKLVAQHITGKHKDEMRSDVSYLLHGQESVPDDDAERLAVIDNLSGILHVLAREWLDARRPYNAIKHRLRVSQTDASFSLGRTPDDLASIADGPSIKFLNHTDWEPRPPGEGGGKMRHWSVETHWINFGRASNLIAMSCMLIDCLWSLAVARWSASGTDEVRLALLDSDEINPKNSAHKRRWDVGAEDDLGFVHRDEARLNGPTPQGTPDRRGSDGREADQTSQPDASARRPDSLRYVLHHAARFHPAGKDAERRKLFESLLLVQIVCDVRLRVPNALRTAHPEVLRPLVRRRPALQLHGLVDLGEAKTRCANSRAFGGERLLLCRATRPSRTVQRDRCYGAVRPLDG